jgi:DNA-binding protein H-NS
MYIAVSQFLGTAMDDNQKALEKIEADNKKLADQIAENNKKRESIIAETKKKVIENVQAQVKQYNITADEIFGTVKVSKAKKPKKSADAPVFLYKNENGEGWSGARGRLPNWVKAIKDAGGDIERYRV